MKHSITQRLKFSAVERFAFSLTWNSLIANLIIFLLYSFMYYLVYVQNVNYQMSEMLDFLIENTTMFPIALYAYLDLLTIANREMMEACARRSSKLKMLIHDPNVFTELGHLDYLLVDAPSAFMKHEYKVSALLLSCGLFSSDGNTSGRSATGPQNGNFELSNLVRVSLH